MRGITIKVGRVRRRLTQTDLAQRLGFSQTEISKLERDIFQASRETAAKIRQIFKSIDGDADGNEKRSP